MLLIASMLIDYPFKNDFHYFGRFYLFRNFGDLIVGVSAADINLTEHIIIFSSVT